MIKYICILSLYLFFLGCGNEKPKQSNDKPVIQKISNQVPAFDGKIAFDYLAKQTSFGSRAPGSTAHDNCLAFLQSELQKYADAVNLQSFSHVGYDKKNIQMTNVIASFNLKATTRILLLAHWDSRPRAEQDKDVKKRNTSIIGANDGASGVAVLLEIARHMKAQPPSIGVDILLTDGEDYGKEGDINNYFLGARYFANNLPPGFKPAFGVLLDMVGDAQLEIRKERFSMKYAPDVVEMVWSAAKAVGVDQFSDDVQGPVEDDHLPLNDVGIKTIDLIDFSYPDESNRYWHTTQDTPDKCSPESLEAIGKVLMHVIYYYPF